MSTEPAEPAQPTRPPEPTVRWWVSVEADAAYHAVVAAREGPDAELMAFPTGRSAIEVPLLGDEVIIGRSPVDGGDGPPLGIDLSGPIADPGVSRVHAVLQAHPDGWVVLDPGSTNGTTVNGDDEPIETDEAIPLVDGDRIHVGAWTTLVLRAGS